MFRPVLTAAFLLIVLGTAAGQDSPFGLPKPLGGPIVGTDGKIRSGMDAHTEASPWSGGVDVGVSGATGNTNTFTVRAGLDVRYDDPDDFFIFNVLYCLTQSAQGEIENQGFGLFRNEMPIDGGIGWYAQVALEYDEFRTIYLRASSHSGATYTFLQDANQVLKLRAGAGVAREWGGPSSSDWVPEGQAGFDYEYRISQQTKFSIAGDYYPDISDINHYRLRGRASLDILLDPSSNIYLRLGAFDRYDNYSYGSKRNDLTYWMMLQFKF